MADVIEKTTVTVDSLTLGGNPEVNPIKIRLESNEVQYKENTSIRSTEFTVTPNSMTGVASFDLIETDNMQGIQKYIFNFGDGVVYRASVPSVGAVDFFDLPSLERSAYDRDYPFKGF